MLIIEDDLALGTTLIKGLQALGWSTELQIDGAEGLWTANEFMFDVIICDVRLPSLSGYEIIKRLRAHDNWTPILMLTAQDGDYNQANAFDLGADDYLTKPFSFVVLNARLHALTRRSIGERPSILQAGSLVLDPVRQTVERSGVRIELTAREFAVLEYLIRRVEQVCSKTEILAGVWDSAYDGDPNIVEVYAGHLRRKIDVPFGTATLQTVRGRGYMLTAES